MKVGVAKPRYALTRTCGISSCSEAEGYSPPTPARDTYASGKISRFILLCYDFYNLLGQVAV